MASATKHERELRALEREFKAWRRKRRRGMRIPETLWTSAVSASRVHGLWRISKRLTLDYYALRKRSKAQANGGAAVESREGTTVTPAPQFVELPWAVKPKPECLLELEDGRGTTLRVGLSGDGVQQLETAARLLWELSR